MATTIAQESIISILIHLFFIGLTWWALLGFKIDVHLKSGKVVQARVFIILITIAIGSSVANFFLDYLFWSQQLKFLF